jgi:Xaa-Pro aminopeptidase
MKGELLKAQMRTVRLFEMIERGGLIRPGKSEQQLVSDITQLAAEGFDIRDHWHKKIVRVGRNTLASFSQEPSDEILRENDILFIDLGPIVEGLETDIGRTYVLGNDPKKNKLKHDVERAWYEIQKWMLGRRRLTGAAVFQKAVDKAREYGWEFTGDIAGHIVGRYPHEQPVDPKSLELDFHPDNHHDIFRRDANGEERHWILELQFIDRELGIGAYFEQLLCTDRGSSIEDRGSLQSNRTSQIVISR